MGYFFRVMQRPRMMRKNFVYHEDPERCVFRGPQDPLDTAGYQKISSRSVPHHTGCCFPLRSLTTGYPLHGGSVS